jgi:serine/threonine protein kinase
VTSVPQGDSARSSKRTQRNSLRLKVRIRRCICVLSLHFTFVCLIYAVAIGSPYYMAPEQMTSQGKGNELDSKADVWSVGGLVLFMVTGDHPWQCEKFRNAMALFAAVLRTHSQLRIWISLLFCIFFIHHLVFC